MISYRDLANALRALSIDAIEKAKSGHPGMPLGMADIATVLWRDFLVHNPQNPKWWNRDRFILSNGHGSMLLYALLHLSGYHLSIEQLQQFRQLHSQTPGHPEFGETPGVETTTGPLGQGLANAVGMAMAEKILSAQFNRPNHTIINHYTYVFVGDGCLMEGISHEVSALAGVLGLEKLIVLWDNNGISIDGNIEEWMECHPAQRFESYGWHVIDNVNGHDDSSIRQALKIARNQTNKPSFICCQTEIGYGSPNKVNTPSVHGSPLGSDEAMKTKRAINWPYPPFVIPQSIYKNWNACEKGKKYEEKWQQDYESYQQHYPELASELKRRMQKILPSNFTALVKERLDEINFERKTLATRQISRLFLERLAPNLPEIIGGSADLSGSNCSLWSTAKKINHHQSNGNYIHYGVREFGMMAMMTGVALHGGFIPFGGTFLVFSTYSANAIRMAALMQQQVIYLLTHDSIGLGEDGPTHQPVEQLTLLRTIPNLSVWRPCDMTEGIVAWQHALTNHDRPTALCLSRQSLPTQPRNQMKLQAINYGGYILHDCHGTPDLIIIATGSEVALAVTVLDTMNRQPILFKNGNLAKIRLVSMPCTDVFDRQPKHYRETVLPPMVRKRLAIEAASSAFWYKYVGLDGAIIGLDRFGLSAPANEIFKSLGFNVDHIMDTIKQLLCAI